LFKESASSAFLFGKMKAILAAKGEMQTIFDAEGRAWPATRLTAGPCTVTALKTSSKDGYEAVQLSFGLRKKKVGRAMAGLVKKTGLQVCPRVFREVEAQSGEELKIGQEIKVEDVLKEGDKVVVAGISKGKGFVGVVKRWHFKGGPRTHGQSDRERAPGSIGSTTTPGRVYKGKRMAGRMGGDKITVKNLKVLKIEPAQNLLWVSGAVPGAKGSLVTVTKIK